MPWLNRFDDEWLARARSPSSASSSSRITRRSAGSATRSAERLGRHVAVLGVEGWPACGTPAEALAAHGLDGASVAPADRGTARGAREVGAGRSGSCFRTGSRFDCSSRPGSWSGLKDRLGERLRRCSRPQGGRRTGAPRAPGTRAVPLRPRSDARLIRASGRPSRIDRALDRQLGYYPLAMRLNRRHGFHGERMAPGHPNWMLDSDARRRAAALGGGSTG